MQKIADIRRRNLWRIVQDRFGGNVSALARAANNRQPSFFNDLFAQRKKTFGEKLARNLERDLGLEAGALDRPDGPGAPAAASAQRDEIRDQPDPPPWPFPNIPIERYERLPKSGRLAVEAAMLEKLEEIELGQRKKNRRKKTGASANPRPARGGTAAP